MHKKIYCESLVIEVGRMCNLCCSHCLRGEREDKTVDTKLVKKFLRKEVDAIGSITFTGGEPTLYEKEIIQIIDYIIKLEIPCESFYVASNGLVKAPKLMVKLAEFYAYTLRYSYSREENYSQFELSNDEFHEDVPEENKQFFQAFAFYSERTYKGWDDSWIPEGRAYLSGLGGGRGVNKEKAFYVDDFDDDVLRVEMVYFNAEGFLLPDCDYSYESQREMEPFAYGSMPLEKILKTYNQVNNATEEVA